MNEGDFLADASEACFMAAAMTTWSRATTACGALRTEIRWKRWSWKVQRGSALSTISGLTYVSGGQCQQPRGDAGNKSQSDVTACTCASVSAWIGNYGYETWEGGRYGGRESDSLDLLQVGQSSMCRVNLTLTAFPAFAAMILDLTEPVPCVHSQLMALS